MKIIENIDNGYEHFLTVGQLREFLENNKNIPDDAKVLVQRVEDVYYEKHGWGVVLKEGEHYHSHLEMNKNMREEIERRARGEEPHYAIDDPNEAIMSDEDLEMIKEQYHPAWCCVKYKEDKHLYIDLHY